MNAVNELRAAVPGAKGEGLSTALETSLGEAGEASGIGAWSIGDADDAFITGHLAFAAETVLDPGESGVQREDDEAKFLEEVGPVVVAAQVFGFVEDDLLEFARCDTGEEPLGNEDARREESDDAGAVEHVRGADGYAPGTENIERSGKGCAELNRLGGFPQPTQPDGVHGEIGRADERSEDPESGNGEAPPGIELEQSVS